MFIVTYIINHYFCTESYYLTHILYNGDIMRLKCKKRENPGDNSLVYHVYFTHSAGVKNIQVDVEH